MKVALVYDRVNKWGGAERVLLTLHELFPDAPLYTSVYNKKTAPWAKVFPKVIPSFLQNFPFAKIRHDLYAPIMPFAFESFNFSKFDLVISVSSEAAKGIITSPQTLHINYCLTPTRYLWSGYESYFNSSFKRIVFFPVIQMLKAWDLVAAQRSDEMISISHAVQKRIKKYYKRSSNIIFPPVEIERFQKKTSHFRMAIKNLPVGEYFLIVSRLVPYKNIDLAINAFNKLKLPLVIVGMGSEYAKLSKISEDNIRLFGPATEDELVGLYKSCKAFVLPQDEDFGIAAVEAQASGKPVIAYKGGGALDTIIEGKTGIFFQKQDIQSIINAVVLFNKTKFNPQDSIQNAKRFSTLVFKDKIMAEVKRIWYTHKQLP